MGAVKMSATNPIVTIRTDSSTTIGSGHLMRCLTLAKKLQKKGFVVHFICRDFPGNLCNLVEQEGFKVDKLPYREDFRIEPDHYPSWLGMDWWDDVQQTIDKLMDNDRRSWLIVDHYAIDHKWEKAVAQYFEQILVIDDLANRNHYCSALLDQNYTHGLLSRYDGLVPPSTALFLGPKHALLREEFLTAKRTNKNQKIERVISFFGGSDLTNETIKLLEVIDQYQLNADLQWEIVVGSANSNKERIRKICETRPNMNFYSQVNNMADLMAKADLFIGAGGSTTWERCFLGIPSITIAIADNQVEILKAVASFGATTYLGTSKETSLTDLYHAIKTLLENPDKLTVMSEKAEQLMQYGTNTGLNLVDYMWENTAQ